MKRMRTRRKIPGFIENEIMAIPGPMHAMGGTGMRGRMYKRGRCREVAFGIENFEPRCGPRYSGISTLDSEEARSYQILDLEEKITWHKFRLAEISQALENLGAIQEDEDVSKIELEKERAYLEMRKRTHEAKIGYYKRLKELLTSDADNRKTDD